MASIPPHGEYCYYCDGLGAPCEACHGTGRACPGGEVREAVYLSDIESDGCVANRNMLYICQTCHTVVPASEVQQ